MMKLQSTPGFSLSRSYGLLAVRYTKGRYHWFVPASGYYNQITKVRPVPFHFVYIPSYEYICNPGCGCHADIMYFYHQVESMTKLQSTLDFLLSRSFGLLAVRYTMRRYHSFVSASGYYVQITKYIRFLSSSYTFHHLTMYVALVVDTTVAACSPYIQLSPLHATLVADMVDAICIANCNIELAGGYLSNTGKQT